MQCRLQTPLQGNPRPSLSIGLTRWTGVSLGLAAIRPRPILTDIGPPLRGTALESFLHLHYLTKNIVHLSLEGDQNAAIILNTMIAKSRSSS
jgi:hypothetical protein